MTGKATLLGSLSEQVQKWPGTNTMADCQRNATQCFSLASPHKYINKQEQDKCIICLWHPPRVSSKSYSVTWSWHLLGTESKSPCFMLENLRHLSCSSNYGSLLHQASFQSGHRCEETFVAVVFLPIFLKFPPPALSSSYASKTTLEVCPSMHLGPWQMHHQQNSDQTQISIQPSTLRWVDLCCQVTSTTTDCAISNCVNLALSRLGAIVRHHRQPH